MRSFAASTILVVQRDQAVQEVLTTTLTDEGYRVIGATSIGEGINALGGSPIDLVLTDSFSEQSGSLPDALVALVQAAGSTPVVLVTGYRFSEAQVQAAGIHAVIEKPFNIDDLTRRVDALLHGG